MHVTLRKGKSLETEMQCHDKIRIEACLEISYQKMFGNLRLAGLSTEVESETGLLGEKI